MRLSKRKRIQNLDQVQIMELIIQVTDPEMVHLEEEEQENHQDIKIYKNKV